MVCPLPAEVASQRHGAPSHCRVLQSQAAALAPQHQNELWWQPVHLHPGQRTPVQVGPRQAAPAGSIAPCVCVCRLPRGMAAGPPAQVGTKRGAAAMAAEAPLPPPRPPTRAQTPSPRGAVPTPTMLKASGPDFRVRLPRLQPLIPTTHIASALTAQCLWACECLHRRLSAKKSPPGCPEGIVTGSC